MPQAVTHVIIALIIASLVRELSMFKREGIRFPLHYVLIAGVAGLLPDIDIILYWGLYFAGLSLSEVHRTFTHTIFVPLIFIILAGVFYKYKNKEFGKHSLTLTGIFLMLALGSFVHLVLDASIAGAIRPLYPFSQLRIGFSIVDYLPKGLKTLFFPTLDAILLVLWLIYLEVRHRISDFI